MRHRNPMLGAMLGIISLILAIVLAERLGAIDGSRAPALLWVPSGMACWLLLAAVLHRSWRQAGPRAVAICDLVLLVLALVLHGCWCLGSDLTRLPGQTADILPFLTLLVSGWYLAARNRLPAAEATRLVRLRFQLMALPLLCVLVLLDLLHGGGDLLGLDGAQIEELDPFWQLVVAIASFVLLWSLLPVLVTRLWRTRSLPPGPLRERIQIACRLFRVRVEKIRTWPGRSGLYNAAVLGILPRSRFLLFSEDLLQALHPDQLTAVIGHELGHIRHGHLWLYILFLMTAALLAQLCAEQFIVWGQQAGLDSATLQLLAAIGFLGVLALLLGLGLGSLSRTCERQADLAGAELAGSPRAMQEALAAVARLSGQDPRSPSWMHGSIASRISYLDRVRRDPGLIHRHTRLVMKLRILIIIAIGILFLVSLERGRGPGAAWLLQDELRADAVHKAVAGDGSAFYDWLLAHPEQRGSAAKAILDRIAQHDQQGRPVEIYAERELLLPFRTLTTGNDELDYWMRNTLAYTLVAYTRTPTARDLNIAESLLPQLEADIDRFPKWDLAVSDTIGCLHFVLDRRTEAATWFDRTIHLVDRDLQDADDQLADQLMQIRQLAVERRRACDEAGAPLPLEPAVLAQAGPEVEVESTGAEAE